MDDVTIEAIKFNHDSNSITSDALTIRMNEQNDVTVPEWMAGQPSFPAAYANSQGNRMKIAVRLKKHNSNVKSVELSGQSDRLLGAVKAETPVGFTNGVLSEVVMLDLNGASIAEAGVGSWDVTFTWTLIADTNPGKKILNTTKHRIYTLLERPNPPWGSTAEDLEPPWADMLELVCPWATGARNRTEAASMITEELHKLGHVKKLRFDENMSFSRLALNGTDRFDLRDLLTRLKDPKGSKKVNCTDCAILVSSFANLLGCDLYQSRMGPQFLTNQIRPIGADWKGKRRFQYHEVAWEDPCKDQARLFDCFLEVDGDPKTTAANQFEAVLPVNMPFRDSRDGGYYFRLVQPISSCEADDKNKIRRKIARNRFAVRPSSSDLIKVLAREFRFSDWKDLPFTQRFFDGPINKLNEEFLSTGWHRVHLKELEGEQEVLELRDTVWQSSGAPDTAVRVLTYRCRSITEAMAFLLNLLGDFQMAGMVPRAKSQTTQGPFAVGDLAFSGREDQTILFIRSNVVVFLQNAGNNSISLLRIAHDIDQEIRNVLDPEAIKLKETALMSTDFRNTVWSSITPPYSSAPVEPTDMKRTGRFKIKTYDPTTGYVTGRYLDLVEFEEVDFKGCITPNGTSYSFVFKHDVLNTNDRRVYRGQIIAYINGITVVAGQWNDEPNTDGISKETDEAKPAERTDEVKPNRAQDEGVWVATKP